MSQFSQAPLTVKYIERTQVILSTSVPSVGTEAHFRNANNMIWRPPKATFSQEICLHLVLRN